MNNCRHRCIRCPYGRCSSRDSICSSCRREFFGHPTFFSHVPGGKDLLYEGGEQEPKKGDLILLTDKIGSFPDGKILPMGNEWIKGLRNIRENTNHTIIYPREAVLVMREDGSHDADPVDSSEFKELRLALWKAKLDPTKFEYCPCTHGIYEVRSVTLMPQVQFVKRKEDEVDLNISFPVHAFEFSNCYDSEEAAVNAAKEFFIEMRGDLDSLLV